MLFRSLSAPLGLPLIQVDHEAGETIPNEPVAPVVKLAGNTIKFNGDTVTFNPVETP